MNRLALAFGRVALLALLGVGCTKDVSVEPEPKPASCEALGGQILTVDTSEGPKSMCMMNDGSRCEAAELPGPCACAPCIEYAPPAPGFCADGILVGGVPDACGCMGHPTCER